MLRSMSARPVVLRRNLWGLSRPTVVPATRSPLLESGVASPLVGMRVWNKWGCRSSTVVPCRRATTTTVDTPALAKATHDLEEELKKHFGFTTFTPGQEKVISSILSGRDALAVLPTGGGKSLCYQLPSVLHSSGVAIVVSPLIALMKDQCDSLQRKGIKAAMINSFQTKAEQLQIMQEMVNGAYKLVYVSPERFKDDSFLAAMDQVFVSLFAVDEAHCISQWGHDFRPDYARLGAFVERLVSTQVQRPVVAAFTATAGVQVRQDIVNQLRMRNPLELVQGFARPNLSLHITKTEETSRRRGYRESLADIKVLRMKEIVQEMKKGIIYVSTRKRVDLVLSLLRDWGVESCEGYHAGMSDNKREQAQDRYMSGQCDVMVATNAFGMGIDRADVRFVLHFAVPASVEAYYQEVGRAGRDGLPARCELLFDREDIRLQEYFIATSNPTRSFIESTWRALLNVHRAQLEEKEREREIGLWDDHEDDNNKEEQKAPTSRASVEEEDKGIEDRDSRKITIKRKRSELTDDDLVISLVDLAGLMDSDPAGLSRCMSILESHGYLERFLVAGERVKGTRLLRPSVSANKLELDLTAVNENRIRQQRKLDALLELIRSRDTCRQQWIMHHFGEAGARPCGKCDVCAAFPVGSPSLADRAIMTRAMEAVQETNAKVTQMYKWGRRAGRGEAVGIAGATKEQIIRLLMGSRAKEMAALGLNKLESYGKLRPRAKAKGVKEGVDAETMKNVFITLEKEGYVETATDEEEQHVLYPRVVLLTPKGRQWLKDLGTPRHTTSGAS